MAVDHLDPDQVAGSADRHPRRPTATSTCSSTTSGAARCSRAARPSGTRPIWEHDLDDGLRILRLAIDTHLITSHHLLPLLVDRPGGLLVEVTDGTADYNASRYRISVFYDLAKVAVNRLAFSQGHELRAVRRDRGRDHAGLAALRDDARGLRRVGGELARRASATSRAARTSRSPSRRATSAARSSALAADPDRARWNQQSVDSGRLAREYGFTDVDGSQPDFWRYIDDTAEGGDADPEDYR